MSPGGTVAVQSGTLGLQGGGTETGASFSIAGGAALDFAGSTAFTVDSGTTFGGAGNLIKDGPTTLTLSGNGGSLTGPTTVKAGDLLVNGSLAGSAVSVLSGATLGGSGTVGAVSTTGGTVNPGDNPGILNVQGNVTLDPSATFGVALNGPAPSTGYDQLNVTGSVNLNGSTLDPSLGFSPSGETFTIIRSTAPITGTFHGLSEGGTLLINGRLFKISYAAGNGHNVALTVISPAEPPQILTGGSATFTAGTAGDFTVASVGQPLPTLSETGAFPSHVSFVDNGDGTASLAGTPAAGSGGVYHLTITAANGQTPNATEDFTLTVDEAPSITSAAAAPFVVGVEKSFTLTTTGFPTATLSESGALPSGLTFVDNGDGTAALTGKPAAGSGGVYHLTVTAANGVGAAASQDFTLTVASPSSSASPTINGAASTTFQAGQKGSFLVVATGSPTPTFSETGVLPPGVTFVDNGNGTATLAGTPAANVVGVYHADDHGRQRRGHRVDPGFHPECRDLHPSGGGPPPADRGGARPTQIVLSFDEAVGLRVRGYDQQLRLPAGCPGPPAEQAATDDPSEIGRLRSREPHRDAPDRETAQSQSGLPDHGQRHGSARADQRLRSPPRRPGERSTRQLTSSCPSPGGRASRESRDRDSPDAARLVSEPRSSRRTSRIAGVWSHLD